MGYDRNSDHEHILSKGPFYLSAAFVFFALVLFASFEIKESGSLDHWGLATCVFGSGFIAILLFIPGFLQDWVDEVREGNQPSGDELFSKAYFELKEARSELEALAVKIDKVPTLVEKILSSARPAVEDLTDSAPSAALIEQLGTKVDDAFSQLQDLLSSQSLPALPEPDLNEISSTLSEIKSRMEEWDSLLREQSSHVLHSKVELPGEVSMDSEISLENGGDADDPEAEDLLGIAIDDQEDAARPPPPDNRDPREVEPDSEIDPPESEELEEEEGGETEAEQLAETTEGSQMQPDPEAEITAVAEKSPPQEVPPANEELNLGLPTPEETLRKVDALLAGKDPEKNQPSPAPSLSDEDKGELTTVVANVMIGIGNKPFLRGEGPGLSWEEGVAMNFVEIGKWAWTPPRKKAGLTVQVYRNDRDPDKGGKLEVKPGQKLEITPEFS